MAKTNKQSIDIAVVSKLVAKLTKNKEFKNIEIDTKQFLIDVLTKNYKLDKKNTMILIGSLIALLTPTEVLTSMVFGRISFLIDKLLGVFDEAFFVYKIIEVIIEETKGYSKFVNSDKYKPSELKVTTIELKPREMYQAIKLMISDNIEQDNMSLALTTKPLAIEDVFRYTEEDYKVSARRYLEMNQSKTKDDYVLVKGSKVQKSVVMKSSFSPTTFESVIQSKMNEEVESSKNQLSTYRLSKNITVVEEEIGYESKVFKQTKTYSIETNNIEIKHLNFMIREVNNLEENIDNVVFILPKLLIEVCRKDNCKCQVLTWDLNYVNVADAIKVELEKQLKSLKNPISLSRKAKVIDVPDNLMAKQVEFALERINIIFNDQEVVSFSNDELLSFIPMYNKKNKTQYLIYIQNKVEDVTVSSKKTEIKLNTGTDYRKNINKFNVRLQGDYIMLTNKVEGELDVRQLLNLLQDLFLIQYLVADSSELKCIVNTDCGNKVLLQTDLTKDLNASMIDGTARFNSDIENQIESLIKQELKSVNKSVNKYVDV